MKNLSKKLSFSFDIGFASIGWSVIEYENAPNTLPQVIGTGVVTFEADSCLASKRREHRRTRRTIRARRKRIERIGKILVHHNIITADDLKLPGHPAPFLLAARALQGKQKLTGPELWHVLRWYAHNRGYDANKQWSRTEEKEDTERVTLAKNKMSELGTSTMAETVSAILDVNTNLQIASFTINSPKYKNLNIAFPRDVVENEVKRILETASDIPADVVNLIIDSAKTHKEQLSLCDIRFPLRYSGSILFGQLVPRFDNRIIARCPITWANTYRNAIESGESAKKAKQQADKFAKVPNADCAEFYEYRFARILANIRVNAEPIAAEIRQKLMETAKQKGRFTKTEFSKLVAQLTDNQPNNLKNYFHLVPDADEALIVVPQNEQQKKSGRAPYARPVLKQVVEEILRGEDATKPAKSLTHPTGEIKKHDGILYSLSDPESDVSKLIANRSIEEQTNNHLVRHRMLIFGRLLRDMIAHYAEGDANRITTCCIEVNRDLKEFSGKTNKEIAQLLSEKKKHFVAAKKYLKDNAPELPLSGGLIRKCRIAMDMKWTCPYTGMAYGVYDLPKMDKEHIVPFASRNTNSMAALVLTYPEVNRMKGKRTGLEFIRECQGQAVAGRENLTIITEKRYKTLVENLNTQGSPDDRIRKTNRKKLLLVESAPQRGDTENKLGFTEGQLTQSSQLMRLGAQVIKKQLHHTRVISIPGQVTAETRKAWKLMGTLAQSEPNIIDETTGLIKEKEEIRNITHLHHAIDACVIGLIPILIPCGDNGSVWRMIVKRTLNEADKQSVRSLSPISAITVEQNNRLMLNDIPTVIKNSISCALMEKRVIRHVPSDMSGAKLLEQYKGIKIDNNTLDDTIILRSRNKKTGRYETKSVNKSKVVGLQSKKLQNINSVIPIEGNYAIALDPEPSIIRHIGVYKQLAELKRKNNDKEIRMIRAGQLIKIENHKNPERNRVWRVISVMDKKIGLCLNLQIPNSAVNPNLTHSDNWQNVPLLMLLKSGLNIIKNSYIGY